MGESCLHEGRPVDENPHKAEGLILVFRPGQGHQCFTSPLKIGRKVLEQFLDAEHGGWRELMDFLADEMDDGNADVWSEEVDGGHSGHSGGGENET